MNECAEGQKKFIAAVAVWMGDDSDEAVVPEMVDFGLCRSCSLSMFERIMHLAAVYTADVHAIIAVTQEQIDQLPALKPPPEEQKH